MARYRVLSIIALITFTFLGCQKDTDGSRCWLNGTCDGNRNGQEVVVNDFTCSASPSKNTVEPNEVVSVTLQVHGGVSPFYATGSGSFGSFTTLSRQFSGTGVHNEIITVYDSDNSVASCAFTVNVATDTSEALACTIATDGNSLYVDLESIFTLTVTGGQSPYDYSFRPSAGHSSPISIQGSASITTVPVTFTSGGRKTATLVVTSDDDRVGVCNQSLQVFTPRFDIASSPSTTVTVTDSIILIATPHDFPGTPTYSFTTTTPNVSISSISNHATVAVTDGISRPVTVGVTVSVDGISKTSFIHLNFIGDSISCTAIAANDIKLIGEELSVDLSGPQSLEIIEVQPGSGGIVISRSNPFLVRYTTPGSKIIRVKARSLATLGLCNGGDFLQIPVTIKQQVSCDAQISPNPSIVGQTSIASASIPSNSGSGNVKLVRIRALSSSGLEYVSSINDLEKTIRFSTAGTYRITFEVEDEGDSLNRTATCSTNHRVIRGTPHCTATFHNGVRPITSAFFNTPLKIRVNSSLSRGRVALDPGAPIHNSLNPGIVNFPVYANGIIYKNPGLTTAHITVTDLTNNLSYTCSATINLIDPSPVVNITANHSSSPIVVGYNRGATIRWNVRNVRSCHIDSIGLNRFGNPVGETRQELSFSWTDLGTHSGSFFTGALPQTRRYNIICDNRASDSVLVRVRRPTVRTLACSSSRYRYNECLGDGRLIVEIRVLTRYSVSGCHKNRSYGIKSYDPTKIWVNHGCRALFEVTYR